MTTEQETSSQDTQQNKYILENKVEEGLFFIEMSVNYKDDIKFTIHSLLCDGEKISFNYPVWAGKPADKEKESFNNFIGFITQNSFEKKLYGKDPENGYLTEDKKESIFWNKKCKYALVYLKKDEFSKQEYSGIRNKLHSISKDYFNASSLFLPFETHENVDFDTLKKLANDAWQKEERQSQKSEILKEALKELLLVKVELSSFSEENTKQESIPVQPESAVDVHSQCLELIDIVKKGIKHGDEQAKIRAARNYVLCTSLGFLTILAGEPGAGKTSIVHYLAKALKLDQGRFAFVAVEKGWTSRQDLMGYRNPLSGNFEASNQEFYNVIKTLDKGEEEPVWVLLDEANLSPMEYYWADFMAHCDLTLGRHKRKISIGCSNTFEKTVQDASQDIISSAENGYLCAGNNLRFLATMNLDRTTELLSPRLVDRAWILYLTAPEYRLETFENKASECDIEDADKKALTQAMVNHVRSLGRLDQKIPEDKQSAWKVIYKKFAEIQAVFKMQNIIFSPRSLGMIKEYCLAALQLTESPKKEALSILDYAVAQKILPLIDGHGEEYKNFLDELIYLLPKEEAPISHDLLQSICTKGKRNMGYYCYFAR